ncbi:hypothetical protein [Nonomuraea recticatena]|uniref:hypothetical protein n=1 Tax=Nonomuraea recticatena TaxID=46178 RepID=UPI0036172391
MGVVPLAGNALGLGLDLGAHGDRRTPHPLSRLSLRHVADRLRPFHRRLGSRLGPAVGLGAARRHTGPDAGRTRVRRGRPVPLGDRLLPLGYRLAAPGRALDVGAPLTHRFDPRRR